MTVPDEAIEAAAKAEYEHEWSALDGTWDATTKEARALFRQSAKVALEAAAPYLRAQALEEAADAGPRRQCPTCGAKEGKPCYGNGPMRISHPARALTSEWLRARAAAERGGE